MAGFVKIFLVLSEGFTLLQLMTDFSGERRVHSGKRHFGNVIFVGCTSGGLDIVRMCLQGLCDRGGVDLALYLCDGGCGLCFMAFTV